MVGVIGFDLGCSEMTAAAGAVGSWLVLLTWEADSIVGCALVVVATIVLIV